MADVDNLTTYSKRPSNLVYASILAVVYLGVTVDTFYRIAHDNQHSMFLSGLFFPAVQCVLANLIKQHEGAGSPDSRARQFNDYSVFALFVLALIAGGLDFHKKTHQWALLPFIAMVIMSLALIGYNLCRHSGRVKAVLSDEDATKKIGLKSTISAFTLLIAASAAWGDGLSIGLAYFLVPLLQLTPVILQAVAQRRNCKQILWLFNSSYQNDNMCFNAFVAGFMLMNIVTTAFVELKAGDLARQLSRPVLAAMYAILLTASYEGLKFSWPEAGARSNLI